MYGLIAAGASLVMFGCLYLAGVAEARSDLRRSGRWVEPPRPLPPARVVSRRS
jgi:hypothetical protein